MEVFKVIEAKSEAELVAKIRSGDQKAEEQLAERYRRGVLLMVTRDTGDPTIAEDLCQDIFVKTFQAIKQGQIREPEKLPAFIWSLAKFVITEYFRKLRKYKMEVIEDDQFVDSASTQYDQLLQKEKSQIICRAINEVKKAKYRKLLRRYYIDEEDKERICQELGISSRQFNVTLCRARKQLYEKLRGKL
jgi:RNA polymerase sigma-70 factor, ECF subfamily